jgi:hypothetical protein
MKKARQNNEIDAEVVIRSKLVSPAFWPIWFRILGETGTKAAENHPNAPIFGLKGCLTNSQHSPARILLSGF